MHIPQRQSIDIVAQFLPLLETKKNRCRSQPNIIGSGPRRARSGLSATAGSQPQQIVGHTLGDNDAAQTEGSKFGIKQTAKTNRWDHSSLAQSPQNRSILKPIQLDSHMPPSATNRVGFQNILH